MDEVALTGEAAVVASEIRSVDRQLDQMDRDRDDSIVRGMAAPGAASVVIKWGQDRADERRRALESERAALVTRLKALVSEA